jgi:hypothetical protein
MGSRVEWKVKERIMNTIIHHGGVVFGGAVRDKYLHDAHASKFFQEAEAEAGERTVQQLYQDANYLPEYSGRFVVPNDIDAYVHITDHQRVVDALRRLVPKVTKVFERDLKEYFPETNVLAGTIIHHRYFLHTIVTSPHVMQWITQDAMLSHEQSYIGQQISGVLKRIIARARKPVVIDLLVHVGAHNKQPDPPFGVLDFECNALILDASGFRLSREFAGGGAYQRYQTMERIMQDIEAKRARVTRLDWHRVRKMKMRGWKIHGVFEEIEEVHGSEDYPGHCLICHGNLTKVDIESDRRATLHLKLKCCDARYHPRCLVKAYNEGTAAMVDREKCTMCSKDLICASEDAELLATFVLDMQY